MARSSAGGSRCEIVPNGGTCRRDAGDDAGRTRDRLVVLGRLAHAQTGRPRPPGGRRAGRASAGAACRRRRQGPRGGAAAGAGRRARARRPGRPARLPPRSGQAGSLRRGRLHVCASDAEGWGQVVIEAAAYGVPTLARDVPGLRDSIRHGAPVGWFPTRSRRPTLSCSRSSWASGRHWRSSSRPTPASATPMPSRLGVTLQLDRACASRDRSGHGGAGARAATRFRAASGSRGAGPARVTRPPARPGGYSGERLSA